MAQSIPNRATKKWRISYKGAFFGDLTKNFLINLYKSSGLVRVGSKLFPHSVTSLLPPSDYTPAKIYNGSSYVQKLWAITPGKEIWRSLANAAFGLETATGFNATETTDDGSDIINVPDPSDEPIEVVELSTPAGSGAISITGEGNTVKWAQSFTHVGGPFKQFSFFANKVGSPTDNLKVGLFANSAGAPTGAALITLNIAGAGLTTTPTIQEKDNTDFSPTSYQLDAGATYHWVFERTGSSSTSDYYQVTIAFGGTEEDEDPYENGTLIAYNGSAWAPTLTYTKVDTFTSDGVWTVPAGTASALIEEWACGGYGTANVGGGGGGAYSKKLMTGLTAGHKNGVFPGLPKLNDNGRNSVYNGIRVLAIGGGGGGGGGAHPGTHATGAGGGAGGVQENNFPVSVTSYAVVIGAAGAGGAAGNTGANGSNTTFGALLTALGGGGGEGSGGAAGSTGKGSAGGVYNSSSTIAGTPGQGFGGGGNPGSSVVNRSGGGGGAGGAGGNSPAGSTGGAGGPGYTTDISGASVTYAGGGGAGGQTAPGTGGSGGGGTGGTGAGGSVGANATGYGSGGGGADDAFAGGNGSAGICIVRYVTGTISATGGTITTSGDYTIHTFTSNGTFQVTAINRPVASAFGGKNGYNGGLGGTTAAGDGDTKYAGGDGAISTGDQPGGGGAGDLGDGGDASVGGDIGGAGGQNTGGSGGGEYNSNFVRDGSLYGGGGGSSASSGGSGARGEIRISYPVTAVANYPNVMSRSYGRETTTTSHPIYPPVGTLPGERLLLFISADNSRTFTMTGWTLVGQKASAGQSHAVFTKIADGSEYADVVTTSSATGSTWICERIKDGGTPTLTSTTGSGAIDPPSHTVTESGKHLWFAFGSFSTEGSVSDNPTAPPTNYGSMITQPTTYPYDADNLLAARSIVAEYQYDGITQDPAAFTGNAYNTWVASTIAVPYEATSYFYDVSMAITVEFPQADERLYITTTEDVKFLNAEGGIWQSLWQGIFQQDPLEAAFPHPLKQIAAGQVCFVGDRNKIHSFIATGNNQIEAIPSRIVVPHNYYNTWIAVTKSSVFFGFANVDSESLESLIVYFEPANELSRTFRIKEGATVGFVVDENCHIIDKAGQIRAFNGGAFIPYNYMPPFYDKEKITVLPHRNAFSVKEGRIEFLWKGQYPYPAGQWVMEDDNLYHVKGLVFSGTALNSYGAIEAGGTFRAMFDTGDKLYVSGTVDNGASGVVEGIFSDHKLGGVTVSDDVVGHVQSSRFTSEELDSIWGRVAAKSDNRLEGDTTGAIVLKHRTKKSPLPERSTAPSYAGTWTSSTTFTTTDNNFKTNYDAGDIEIGDEVIIRKGMGAGLLTHIVSVTGTSTRTVTVSTGLAAISSGTFNFSTENWKVMGDKMSVKDTSAEWLELKLEIQKQVGLEELQIGSKINKKLT